MNDLLSNKDFTITANGEAFISQRKAAELIGMPKSTLHDWIHRSSGTLNLNEINQLDAKSFQLAVLSGRDKGIPQAIDLQAI